MNWANSPGPAWATVVLYPWERRAADELETWKQELVKKLRLEEPWLCCGIDGEWQKL